MSSIRHPVGPERPGVYWRRRALVLGVVLLVVVVVVLIVVGRGNGAPGAGPTASPSASSAAPGAGVTPAAGAPSAPSSSAAASSAPASSAPARKDGAACAEDQITLTPVVDERVYAATDDPQIAMTIENTGSNSCHMDLGSAQQVLTITSGTEQYWTSKDCQTGGTNQDVTLKAGQELTTPAITWDRTRSSATTCDAARAAVPAGGASYHLQVTVGEIESAESVQFVLE
ncbi:hypothetical protein DEJ16_06830 [Curtobacterium sp. MCJR17_055]|uniref:hypothetical protein n=1 Tax=unclassified Curtobacterium TaxID=257496 RepID=UPI000D8EC2D3|nr:MULTISPECIES: hypothetical protein [unclassified Curtobacterium]PYY38020.1 hypothetical protein DEI87_02585 [Curtobacterium sp. MCBD17_029]PYY57045.1 hypothetical protein DEJ16_06830 [Curtobacterium sp. MCJR17_055]PYY62039.1 hypothetical protein DEJ26_00695 [Curtobacterium sp. MCPF17_015]